MRYRITLPVAILLAVLVVLIWYGGLFMETRLRLNDLYFVPTDTTGSIVIIAIDDASLSRYGRTPAEWSRDTYVTMLNRLAEAQPRVLALDLIFSDQQDADDSIASALTHLRANEARTRLVLATAGITARTIDQDHASFSLPFSETLPLSPVIAEQANYRGYANTIPHIDGVIRQAPSFITVEGTSGLSFSLATYLAYLRIPAEAASQVLQIADSTLILPNQARIPVDRFGLWQQYYFAPPATRNDSAFEVVSFVDVVDGRTAPDLFKDKIVLVGLMFVTGMLDEYRVPSSMQGNLMAGIEIQANAVESLLQGKAIRTLPLMAQAILLGVLAFASALTFISVRWYLKAAAAFAIVLIGAVSASVLFSTTQYIIPVFDALIAVLLPFAVAIGIEISREIQQRQQKEFLLESLQRIANQRLELKQAAVYILEDLQRAVPGADAALAVFDPHQTDGHQWFSSSPSLKLGEASNSSVTYPLKWQGKQNGMFILSHASPIRLTPDAQHLLGDFAEQLAPNIDNMLLYEEIQRQRSLLDSVFDETSAGLAVVDRGGRIMRVNRNLVQILGIPTDVMENPLLVDLLQAHQPDARVIARITQTLASGEPLDLDEMSLADYSVRISFVPLPTFNLWTVIAVDVTDLVELNKLKSQMLRIASHDLKNPLARILGCANLILSRDQLTEQDQRYMGFITKSSNTMLGIINDILDIERLRSGKVRLEQTNISQMVIEICDGYQPDTIQKQQTLILELPSEDILLQADPGQISLSIGNLIGNAVKYTPDEGCITVRLRQQNGEIRFEVQDTGVGIPKDAYDMLFTEFYRVRNEQTIGISGTGLGLSLVKSVIEAHGGKVGFSSVEGAGSTFYFTLAATVVDALA
jgi:signal transduction histidine kinase/CHASE2 domain-containing sensor protein